MFKTILPLASVIFLRFLGLFIVLPVLAIYATDMPNATPLLISLAIGGYALTQMLFQAPFGYLSDITSRKTMIIIGTIIFMIGSYICYISEDIQTMIIGRLIQGAGAISSTISALASDLIKEEKRSKAMALIGGSIAIGFSISMIASPILSGMYGIESLFLLALTIGFLALNS